MADSFLKYIDTAMRARVWYKFSDLLGITNINQDSAFMIKDTALRHISEKRGAIQAEFITIWREGTEFDWDRQRSVLARREITPIVNGNMKSIRTVPAKLNYTVWFWSKDRDKLNQIAERFLFWQHTDPNLDLLLNNTYPLEFDLHFGAVTDESTTAMTFDKGNYFVIRCPIELEGWIFEITDSKIIKKVFLKIYDNTIDLDGELMYESTTVGVLASDSVAATDSITKT